MSELQKSRSIDFEALKEWPGWFSNAEPLTEIKYKILDMTD